MSTSDEDLKKMQDKVEKLRERVAAEETKRITRERELANDVTYANLEAEGARLEAELAAAKQANSAASIKEGVAGPLEAAKEDKARAEASLEAVSKTADSGTDSGTDK